MKFFGIILIFISAAAVGLFAGEKYLSVLKEIKRTENLLGNIIPGIRNERLSLFELFKNAADSGDETTKAFLKSISPKSLDSAVKIALECGFCSDKAVNSILAEAFSVLGKYPADEQIKELEFCRGKLQKYYEKSEETLLMKAKLSRYCGFFTGAFLAVILF